jgi:DNA-binding NtrC family response regulator
MAEQGKELKVLVFDDDLDICRFSGELLGRRGYHVTTATSPEEAILKLDVERPDIALLDVHTQGRLSGMDVLKYARERLPRCVCLMVTKEDRREAIEAAQREGASEYLTKPVTVRELEAALSRASARVREEDTLHG